MIQQHVEEEKAAESKNNVQTGKKSFEEEQHQVDNESKEVTENSRDAATRTSDPDCRKSREFMSRKPR